jgi:predicted metal-binding membrane protein
MPATVHVAAAVGVGGGVEGTVHWVAMSAAMMLPALLPSARAVGLTSRWSRRQRAQAVYVVSFLLVWTLFGVLLAILGRLLPMRGSTRWLAVAALFVAAVWEISPAVPRYLRAGHRLRSTGNSGWRSDLCCARAGWSHGAACVVTCWALMVAMYLSGSGNLVVMLVLTGVTTARRTLAVGVRLGPVTAVLICALAAHTALG